MRLSLRHLWLFPFIASISWGTTLLILLITWFAQGRPRYPLQSNPYVAYISDIGAFAPMKLIFCIGGILTAIFFTGTICTVHFARYSRKMYGLRDSAFSKIVSWIAVATSVLAGVCLVSLSVLDTYHHNETHSILLSVCFLGLGLSAVCTSFVYFDQTKKSSPYRMLRFYCIVNTSIVVAEVFLGAAFMVLLYQKWWRVAGILEWIVSFLGVFWLSSFVGYVAVPEEGIDIRERDPLLGDSAYLN